MEQIIIERVPETLSAVEQLELLGRLGLAALLGALIGLERELRGYPAGIRTIALVAFGACLFTEISQLLGGNDRVAAQVVTGIGFIGAGVIFREGYSVRGITTAATIWAAAAVGMAIGRELYVAGILGAILVFIVLEARPLTRRMEEAIREREREFREEIRGRWSHEDEGDEDDDRR
jgi:putative Mg2+ transporter-C (MgtC) family protein